MDLPHWLMAIGAMLLVFGFFGLALQRHVQVMTDPDGREGDKAAEAHAPQASMPNPPSARAAS